MALPLTREACLTAIRKWRAALSLTEWALPENTEDASVWDQHVEMGICTSSTPPSTLSSRTSDFFRPMTSPSTDFTYSDIVQNSDEMYARRTGDVGSQPLEEAVE